MSKELIAALEKAVDELKKNAVSGRVAQNTPPSDQHLLDDGWIRHTGDVCPVQHDDVVSIISSGGTTHEWEAGAIAWRDGFPTHYKVTKAYVAIAYDPHAENKELYEQDAKVHKEPWKLWEVISKGGLHWADCRRPPLWAHDYIYRRKQTKQLVDWPCPLLKGVNTNYGELLIHSDSMNGWLTGSQCIWRMHNELRLLPPANDKSNWQAYNGEDLNLPHQAGFVVEVKFAHNSYLHTAPFDTTAEYVTIAAYRVIGIRDGFTDNPAEVV